MMDELVMSETVEVDTAGNVASGLLVAVLPFEWAPGETVTVVSGLPEGCKVERYKPGVAADVDGEVVAVVVRPRDRTERVLWWEALRDRRRVPHPDAPQASERRVWSGGPLAERDDGTPGPFLRGWTFSLDDDGYGGSWSGPSIPVDDDGMVEVLVEDDK